MSDDRDDVWIDMKKYRIVDRIAVKYPCAETEREREARNGPAPYVEYVCARVERVRDE